jgi:hypothetical protein
LVVCLSLRISEQTLFACSQEFLGLFVIHVGMDAFAAAQLSDRALSRNPSSTIRIFSSAEYFLWVFL